MIDIENKSYKPTILEISKYIENPLFNELYEYMEEEYKPLCKIEYSGDKILLGWNVKFKKGGKTLCTIYPRKGYFPMLLVIGRKEKDKVEALMPALSPKFREIYDNTKEGMGQRWIVTDFYAHTALFEDVLKIIRIRREVR